MESTKKRTLRSGKELGTRDRPMLSFSEIDKILNASGTTSRTVEVEHGTKPTASGDVRPNSSRTGIVVETTPSRVRSALAPTPGVSVGRNDLALQADAEGITTENPDLVDYNVVDGTRWTGRRNGNSRENSTERSRLRVGASSQSTGDHVTDTTRVVRNNPANSKPKMKPPVYDGATSWDDYLVQFEMIAHLNNWDQSVMATYLAASLRGTAQAVLGDLDMTRRHDYRALVSSLNQRFGSENMTEMFRAVLKTRTRNHQESLPELAQAIRRLVKQAYPSAPYPLLESLGRDHFVDALTDADTRWRIQQARPQSIDEAVRVAVELEAFQEAEKQRGIYRRSARAIQQIEAPASNEGDLQAPQENFNMMQMQRMLQQIVGQLRDMNRQGQRPRPRQPRPDIECYQCGQPGHIRPDCPDLRNNPGARRQNSGRAGHENRGHNSGN